MSPQILARKDASESSDDQWASAPATSSDSDIQTGELAEMLAELPVPLSEATFCRQMQDRHYELLPLEPPAEIGPVNEIMMEGVSPEKVDNRKRGKDTAGDGSFSACGRVGGPRLGCEIPTPDEQPGARDLESCR